MTGDDGVNLRAWRVTLAGLGASLVGIGLARFAYTPLIPALIAAGWFTPAQAAYLGAANLAGYLAGAPLARRMASSASTGTVLRTMMAVATVGFFACAAPLPFSWFFVWRFGAGIAGGVLMVLAAPVVLAQVPVPAMATPRCSGSAPPPWSSLWRSISLRLRSVAKAKARRRDFGIDRKWYLTPERVIDCYQP